MKGILILAFFVLPLMLGCSSTNTDEGGGTVNNQPAPSPNPQPQGAACMVNFSFPDSNSSIVNVGQTFTARVTTNLPSTTSGIKVCFGGTKIANGQFVAVQDSPDSNCQEFDMADPSQPLDLDFTALEGQQGIYTRYCVPKQNGTILATTKGSPQTITIRSPLDTGKFWVDEVENNGIETSTQSLVLLAKGTFNSQPLGFLLRCGQAQLSSTSVFFPTNEEVTLKVPLAFIQSSIGTNPCSLILISLMGSTMNDFSNTVGFNP